MMTVSALLWDVDRELVSTGFLTIRWYGLFFASGIVAAYLIMSWMVSREKRDDVDLDKLLIILVIAIILGARLVHILYQPGLITENPLEALKFWKGGLASHGGVLGILIGVALFVRMSRSPTLTFSWVMDRLAITGVLAGAFIRAGNFMNSEIVGIQTDVPWAVIFKHLNDGVARHPVQLYEALAYLCIFLCLLLLYSKTRIREKAGYLFSLMLVLVFSARFVLEYFKLQQADYTLGIGMSMGQLLSIPYVFLGLVLIVVIAGRSRQN